MLSKRPGSVTSLMASFPKDIDKKSVHGMILFVSTITASFNTHHKLMQFESEPLRSLFVFSAVVEAQHIWLESITSSPVQALHISNPMEFYSASLLLELPLLGLDKKLVVHYY
jgi:hypothetical protein